MDLEAPHVGFTLLAYIVSGLALFALTALTVLRQRRLRRSIARYTGAHDEPGAR
jgi:heme exporter protein D